MAGIGGFGTRLNGTENFNAAGNTNATATSDLASYIGEVVKVNMSELVATDVDVSSMDSASNHMEFVQASIDVGVIDVELNYDKDEDALILAALRNDNEVWQISFPDNSIWKAVGYVDKMGSGTAGTNEKISRVVSIKVEGIPTHSTTFLAPAAPTP